VKNAAQSEPNPDLKREQNVQPHFRCWVVYKTCLFDRK